MLTSAAMVDSLAEKVDECALNQVHLCTIGATKVSIIRSSGCLLFPLVFLPIVAGYNSPYIPHAINSIVYILSNHASDSRNVPSLKQSGIFCCFSCHLEVHKGIHVSIVVASLDFTSRSSDYVLS